MEQYYSSKYEILAFEILYDCIHLMGKVIIKSNIPFAYKQYANTLVGLQYLLDECP